ncbi:MAG: GNAT family N-acetyltransferase [Actinomycetota bacterium]
MSPVVRLIHSDEEYQAALRVRRLVFVQEQGGPLEDEPDQHDATARHFVMVHADEVIGAARIYQPEAGLTKIGRVCLLPERRGEGLGELLMRELLRYAASLEAARIVLDAQCYAIPFYERLGFRVVGEEFLDAGIPHRRMELPLAWNAP